MKGSRVEIEDKYYARQIDQWDGKDHGGAFRVGKVSKPLLDIGVPDADIWFDQSKAATQLLNKEEITKDVLKQIPSVLEKPVAISESYDNTVMVFGHVFDDKGNPIVVALRVNSTNRRNHITLVNKIRSVGTRSHNLDKLLSEDSLLYLSKNKKETAAWFNALGRSTPFGGTKLGLIRSISFQAENSNRKIKGSAVSAQDSEGRSLSKEQVEYFKDSKVRDENGNLLVMHHGTNADFTVFDKSFIGSTGRYEGSGFNFTPSKERASGYARGNVFSGYVNITNPLSAEKKTISVAKLAKIIREIDPTGDNIISDYAQETRDYGSEIFIARESRTTARAILDYAENDVDIYSSLSVGNPDAESLIDKFEKAGYDGVIHYTDDGRIKTCIAFESKQFKNTDNINPTKNPDIRFSAVGTEALETLEKQNDALPKARSKRGGRAIAGRLRAQKAPPRRAV